MKTLFSTCLFYFLSFFASFTPISAAHAETPPEPEKYTWRGSWTLYPADADLRFARTVNIQKKAKPHYLEAWENGSAVIFPVHISEAGTYSISITYSRFSVMKNTFSIGVFILEEPTIHSMLNTSAHLYAELSTTGESWDDFTQKTLGTLVLPQETVYLLFTNKDHFPHEYVMNLQQVQLQKQ